MDPSETCDLLLRHIKKSNLNYNLSESPFSVMISIKKSFIKDKNGSLRFPLFSELAPQTYPVKNEDQTLSSKNIALKATLAQYEVGKEASDHVLQDLDIKLQKAKVEILDLISDKNQLEKVKENSEKEANDKNFEIKKLKDISNNLNEQVEKL